MFRPASLWKGTIEIEHGDQIVSISQTLPITITGSAAKSALRLPGKGSLIGLMPGPSHAFILAVENSRSRLDATFWIIDTETGDFRMKRIPEPPEGIDVYSATEENIDFVGAELQISHCVSYNFESRQWSTR